MKMFFNEPMTLNVPVNCDVTVSNGEVTVDVVNNVVAMNESEEVSSGFVRNSKCDDLMEFYNKIHRVRRNIGDTYYYVTFKTYKVSQRVDTRHSDDYLRWVTGNYFHSKIDAIEFSRRLVSQIVK